MYATCIHVSLCHRFQSERWGPYAKGRLRNQKSETTPVGFRDGRVSQKSEATLLERVVSARSNGAQHNQRVAHRFLNKSSTLHSVDLWNRSLHSEDFKATCTYRFFCLILPSCHSCLENNIGYPQWKQYMFHRGLSLGDHQYTMFSWGMGPRRASSAQAHEWNLVFQR